jgi:hypothetical protein
MDNLTLCWEDGGFGESGGTLTFLCGGGEGRGRGERGRLYSIVTDLFREATEYKFVVYFVSIVSQYPFISRRAQV